MKLETLVQVLINNGYMTRRGKVSRFANRPASLVDPDISEVALRRELKDSIIIIEGRKYVLVEVDK